MAENTGSNPLALLGRILSVLGYVWVGLVFFGGDLLAQLGIGLRGFGATIIPALLLIGAGRAIRRRGATTSDEAEGGQPRPDVVRQSEPDTAQQPTPDVVATPQSPKPRPTSKPEPIEQQRTEVARSLEQVLAEMEGESVSSEGEIESSLEQLEQLESLDVPPKTSAEMVEEAKHLFDSPPDAD